MDPIDIGRPDDEPFRLGPLHHLLAGELGETVVTERGGVVILLILLSDGFLTTENPVCGEVDKKCSAHLCRADHVARPKGVDLECELSLPFALPQPHGISGTVEDQVRLKILADVETGPLVSDIERFGLTPREDKSRLKDGSQHLMPSFHGLKAEDASKKTITSCD